MSTLPTAQQPASDDVPELEPIQEEEENMVEGTVPEMPTRSQSGYACATQEYALQRLHAQLGKEKAEIKKLEKEAEKVVSDVQTMNDIMRSGKYPKEKEETVLVPPEWRSALGCFPRSDGESSRGVKRSAEDDEGASARVVAPRVDDIVINAKNSIMYAVNAVWRQLGIVPLESVYITALEAELQDAQFTVRSRFFSALPYVTSGGRRITAGTLGLDMLAVSHTGVRFVLRVQNVSPTTGHKFETSIRAGALLRTRESENGEMILGLVFFPKEEGYTAECVFE
jgi:hypothetical protein